MKDKTWMTKMSNTTKKAKMNKISLLNHLKSLTRPMQRMEIPRKSKITSEWTLKLKKMKITMEEI